MQLEKSIFPEYSLIEIKLAEGEIATPEALKRLQPPNVDAKQGVVVCGRAPIWVYAYLVHHYHPTAWVATADPRLGYVIVATHSPEKQVGEIIDPNAPIIV